MTNSVETIGIVIIATAIVALIARMTKQPAIPAYILAGIVVGQILIKHVDDHKAVQNMADLTIIFVMFTIGLEMDLGRMSSLGKVVSLGGVLQFIVVGALGFLIVLPFFGYATAAYMGILFAFASTALVIKSLADRNQLDTLHGGISLGILLLQDMLAVVILSVLPAKELSATSFLSLVLKSFGIVSAGVLIGRNRYLFPWLLRKVRSSAELQALLSLAFGFAFALLAENQGLSGSVGAFITGIALANCDDELALESRLKSLRDFFIPIFFASLGLQVIIPSPSAILPIILLTVAGLTIKPLATATITALFGYQRRTCTNVGLALAPMSEFGLVIVALGIRLGHISGEMMSVAIAIMALSMLLSSYLTIESLSSWLLKHLGFLDRIGPDAKIEEKMRRNNESHDVILVGCHRAGRYILKSLREGGLSVLALEVSYERARLLNSMDPPVPCVYGDALLPDAWERVGDLGETKMVISTISDLHQSLKLLRYLKHKWPHLRVVLSANQTAETEALLRAGADYVFCAPDMAGLAILSGHYAEVFDTEAGSQARQTLVDQLQEMMREWKITPCILQTNGEQVEACALE